MQVRDSARTKVATLVAVSLMQVSMSAARLDVSSQLLLALYKKRDCKGFPETIISELKGSLTADDLFYAARELSAQGLANLLPMLGRSVFAKITEKGIALAEESHLL